MCSAQTDMGYAGVLLTRHPPQQVSCQTDASFPYRHWDSQSAGEGFGQVHALAQDEVALLVLAEGQ
jgi:hypothetical protein